MASLFELLGWVNWEDLEGYNAKESGVFEYSTSKLETIMFVRELNRRLKVRLRSMIACTPNTLLKMLWCPCKGHMLPTSLVLSASFSVLNALFNKSSAACVVCSRLTTCKQACADKLYLIEPWKEEGTDCVAGDRARMWRCLRASRAWCRRS